MNHEMQALCIPIKGKVLLTSSFTGCERNGGLEHPLGLLVDLCLGLHHNGQHLLSAGDHALDHACVRVIVFMCVCV